MTRVQIVSLAALFIAGCGSAASPISPSPAASGAATAATDAGATFAGHPPSAEDIAACTGKAVNAACADVVDGGDPGTCALAADGTTLFCAEAHGGPGGAWVPSAEDVASCSGKAVNAVCTDVVDGGNPGICQLATDGVTLACREANGGHGHH